MNLERLGVPNYSEPFQIHADASDFDIGAVLTQNSDTEWKVDGEILHD